MSTTSDAVSSSLGTIQSFLSVAKRRKDKQIRRATHKMIEKPPAREFLLNAMLENESLTSVDINIQALQQLRKHIPRNSLYTKDRPTDMELWAMIRLCSAIDSSLCKILNLREGNQDSNTKRTVRGARLRESKTVKKSHFICQSCHTHSTPKWRLAPDKIHVLCNVCGLLYAKRASRHMMQAEADVYT